MADTVERIVTLSEVKEMLEKAEADREELSYEQKLALEHARRFARMTAEAAKKLREELAAIEKVDAGLAVRIVDVAPMHPDDVRALMTRSRVNFSNEDIQKILQTVAKYLAG